MTPSPALILLASSLRAAVETASQPGTLAPTYRPALRDAVRFARQMFREWEAMHWRDDLRKSAEQAAAFHRTHPIDHTRDAYVSPFANVTPGTYTGD